VSIRTSPPDVAIGDYIAVLRRHKLMVGSLAFLGLCATLLYSLALATPVYVSHAEVLVKPVLTDPFDASSASDKVLNMGTERELVKSGAVAQKVKEELNLSDSISSLQRRLEVSVIGLTQVLDISFRHTSRHRAQEVTAAFVRSYLNAKQERATGQRAHRQAAIEAGLAPINAKIKEAQRALGAAPPNSGAAAEVRARLRSLNDQAAPYRNKLARVGGLDAEGVGTIVSPARLPDWASSPRPKFNAFLGAFFGFFIGLLVAFIRDLTDGRLRGRVDLEEHLRAPVLATLPRPRRNGRAVPALVTMEHPNGPASEAYRALRTRMLLIAERQEMKIIMVASPSGEEVKTAIAANLAVSLARVGKRVVLLSADVRQSTSLRYLGLDDEPRLSNVLAGEMPPWEVKELLAGLVADFIVIEVPPALDGADCLALAPLVDGILLVADARSTSRNQVTLVREQFDQVGGQVVGAVLSNADGFRCAS
jgi:Mrp family chromosome partitioning ATPase